MKYKLLSELANFEATFPKLLCPARKKEFILDFVYPAVGEGGRFFPLFKVLYTNKCLKNCFYCANRYKRNVERYEFNPDELATLFLNYYSKKWAKGIFISSSIYPNPNKAQEKLLETIKLLREKYNYNDYIHCKILPGADEELIKECAKYSDRLSVNLEAPGKNFLKKLSPDKNYAEELLSTLKKIKNHSQKLKYGIITQFVVGAANENDKEILFYSEYLYKEFNLKRIYYSGFVPVEDTPLDSVPACSKLREYRLYQADFLIRKYKFRAKDFVFGKDSNLILEVDPKMAWAQKNKHLFPLEINRASFEELIKVPGIGINTAKKILEVRKEGKISSIEVLKKLNVILKRASEFITVNGRQYQVKKEVAEKTDKQLFLWEIL